MLWIPKPQTLYEIDRVIKLPSNIIVDSNGAHIKNTATGAPSGYAGDGAFYTNVFYAGNMGGETDQDKGPLYALTYYGIAAANAGAKEITFDSAGDSANFTAGDIVFIKSGAVFAAQVGGYDVPFYVMTNKVESVGSGTLVLEQPLNHNFDATSSIATAAETVTGLDGADTYMAENIHMRGLKLESTQLVNWDVLYLSCYNSTFEDLEIVGKQHGVGMNPGGFVNFKNIRIHGQDTSYAITKTMFEAAHLCNNIRIKGLTVSAAVSTWRMRFSHPS